MARNLLFSMTEGEVGKVMWFKFEPTNNQGVAAPVDISLWDVTITVSQGTSVVINAAQCTPDPDQVANIGEGTFTFDAIYAPLMEAGWYKFQITGEDEGGNVYVFPSTANTDHGRIKVNRAL